MLPALHTPQADLSAIDRANLQPSTREKYRAAVLDMINRKVNPLNADQLATYAGSLSTSRRAHLKAGLAILYRDLVRNTKANATPANVATITAIVYRVEAMQDTIHASQPDAERVPHWLTQSQVDSLLSAAGAQSRRDYVIIGLLVGAGLRREELERLTWDSLATIDAAPVLKIRGKGDKARIVPLPAALMPHLRQWQAETGPGRIARSIHKTGKIGESLSAKGIFDIVRRYGMAALEIPNLDPHDLRRTYGRLVYQQSKDIILVKDLLGHSNVKTTQTYIGLDLHTSAPEIVRNPLVISGAGE